MSLSELTAPDPASAPDDKTRGRLPVLAQALPDGTAYTGVIGRLAVDESGEHVQCHLCGRWLRSIGSSHLRAHGWTAALYREAFGLTRNRSLDSPRRNAQRAAVQRRRMDNDPVIRDAIQRAVQRARSGALSAAARAADRDPDRRTYQRPERRAVMTRNGSRGGAVRAANAAAQRDRTVRTLGFPDVPTYFAARCGRDRMTVTAIARELGVARETVYRLFADHRLTPAQQFPGRIEVQAVGRVGFTSFAEYLRVRTGQGATPAAMGRELGHSAQWIRERARRDGLEALVRPRPTAQQRADAAARDAGFLALEEYLHARYSAAGRRTVVTLMKELGVSKSVAQRLLRAAGIDLGASPSRSTQCALANVGFADLAAYAVDRRRRGYSVQRMAEELGHSQPWLVKRLREAGLTHLIPAPGREVIDADVIARRLGYPDLGAFVRARAAEGATVVDMARELGHSDTWLLNRLRQLGLDHLTPRRGRHPRTTGTPRVHTSSSDDRLPRRQPTCDPA